MLSHHVPLEVGETSDALVRLEAVEPLLLLLAALVRWFLTVSLGELPSVNPSPSLG